MNQKSLRYFLLAGVILIWGVIVFRIINGLNNNDDPANPVRKKVASINYNITKDSFLLIANYPDPFIPGNIKIKDAGNDLQPLTREPVLNNNSIPEQKKIAFDINSIQYHGMIANSETKMKLAIITLADKEYTAKEGDKIELITLRKITKTGIVIISKGKSYTISLKTN